MIFILKGFLSALCLLGLLVSTKDQHFVLIHHCLNLSTSWFSALLILSGYLYQAFLEITMLILLILISFFLLLFEIQMFQTYLSYLSGFLAMVGLGVLFSALLSY